MKFEHFFPVLFPSCHSETSVVNGYAWEEFTPNVQLASFYSPVSLSPCNAHSRHTFALWHTPCNTWISYGKLGFSKQIPSAGRIDLNIAVERSRLEEGEDFQPVLPTAMFFCTLPWMSIFFLLFDRSHRPSDGRLQPSVASQSLKSYYPSDKQR